MSDTMNDAQAQALEKAKDILTEHFDHVLVAVDWECVGDDGEITHAQEGWWHGGSIPAVGLAEWAKARILQPKLNDAEET
jgi:hypothetical protein